MNDNIHYVYYHIDPRTEEIVYVGHGCYERAWICRTTGPGRSVEHAAWCLELMQLGYTPQDWVRVHIWKVTKNVAKDLERIKIKADQPRFNKTLGLPKKLQGEIVDRVRHRRNEGFSYHELGEIFGVSTMTVWRSLNE